MQVQKITAAGFDGFIAGDTPTLIDFYADWCGPCRMLAPVIEQIAEETDDLKVGKVNVDEEMALAMRFGISSIPFVALFQNGELKASSLGFVTADELKANLGLS